MEFALVRQMLGLPAMLEVPSIVAIEPHPDDNEVGAGATLALLAELSCRVVYITVTDGRAGSEDPHMTTEEMVATRSRERAQVNQMIGVSEAYCLNFEDGGDWSERDLMLALVPLLRRIRPAMVMTVDPWTPYESHPDHIRTGKAVATSLIYAKNGMVAKGQGDPVRIPQIAFYGSAYPNTTVDVTRTWQRKLDAIKAHTSQFDTPEWPLISGFFTMDAEERFQREHPGEKGYAEAFKVLAAMQMHFFPDAVRS